MNENIGAKGGTNDRKKVFKILRRNKKKLSKEELIFLEKKVKKQQLINIVTVIPIAIIGTVIATITGITATGERKSKGEKNTKKESLDIEISPNIKKSKYIDEVREKKVLQEKKYTEEDEEKLSRELAKIKSKKIIENYEDKLKELRYKLRNYYYENSIIEEAKLLEDNPSEENLKKINKLIDKLDNYKENISINSTYLVEKDFIKELVEEDIKKIQEKDNLIEETKSDIFHSIDIKVEEIKQIEENIKEKVEQHKVWKNIDEEKLEKLKEKDQNIEKHSNELIKFQDEQDKINRIVNEKLKKEVNIFEKERIQLSGMSIGSSLAVKNIRNSMRPPGVRSGRRVFNFITSYLYYFSMINAIKPIKRRYKKLELKNYKKEVESSLEEIEAVLNDIHKTGNKLEKTIKEFMKKYERYSNTSEYKSILENLKQMQQALLEKEYEIQKIKQEQEKKYQESIEQNKVYKL